MEGYESDADEYDVEGDPLWIDSYPEPDEPDFSDEALHRLLYANEAPPKCPHGNEWVDCDACYVAGDLAYDAARERGR